MQILTEISVVPSVKLEIQEVKTFSDLFLFLSQYMFFFQLPYLPEYFLEMDDFKVYDEVFKVMINTFNQDC